jgi:hypothetical protein
MEVREEETSSGCWVDDIGSTMNARARAIEVKVRQPIVSDNGYSGFTRQSGNILFLALNS